MQPASPIDNFPLSGATRHIETIKRPRTSENPTTSEKPRKLATIGFQTPLPSIAPMEISPYTPENQITGSISRLRNYRVRRALYFE